jgi:NOL1/NOP2/fmu family ribosome biogenesis protein
MRALKILNTREKETLLKELCERFGLDIRLFSNYVLLEIEDEIWISNRDILSHDLSSLPVESLGILFARKKHQTEFTVNAIQLFCNDAGKNVIDLSAEDALKFISGLPVPIEMPNGPYIVKCGKSALDYGHVRKGILQRNTSKK